MVLVLALAEALKDPGWSQQEDDSESVERCDGWGHLESPGEAGFSSGAWCGGEDKLPSDIRVCGGARPGGGWEMLNNQSHDKRRPLTSGLRCDVTECRAGKWWDLSGLRRVGVN